MKTARDSVGTFVHPQKAFTLLELLASILIVGVLAVLLVPSVGGVLEKSRQSRCIGNLRSLHAAMVSYSSDYGGLIVRAMGNPESGGAAWSDSLAPYVGMNSLTYGHPGGTRPQKVFACPKSKAVTNGGARSDYAMNPKAQIANTGMRTIASLSMPSKVVFLIDAIGPNNENTFHLSGASPPSGNWSIDTRHQRTKTQEGNATAVFFDGHAESRKLTDFNWTGSWWDKLPWSPDATE